MNNALIIRFDYNKDRKDPVEILRILTQYVKFYEEIGILTLSAINRKDDAVFEIVSFENGSVIAWIKCKIEEWNSFIFESADELADSIENNSHITTKDELITIGKKLSDSINKRHPSSMGVEPTIDMEKLAEILFDYATINSRLYENENVSIGIGTPGKKRNVRVLNKSFSISHNVIDMFAKNGGHYIRTSYFYVHVSVNRGDNVWKLEEVDLSNTFNAHFHNETWLRNYQTGKIPPIGPNDVLEAKIEYDVFYTKKSGKPKFKNAKIIDVIDIHRGWGRTNDLFKD